MNGGEIEGLDAVGWGSETREGEANPGERHSMNRMCARAPSGGGTDIVSTRCAEAAWIHSEPLPGGGERGCFPSASLLLLNV